MDDILGENFCRGKEWARSGLLEEKTASKVSDEDDR